MCLLSQLMSNVTDTNYHIMQVLHQMFSMSALLLDNALKPAMPLTNVFNCCFKTLTFHKVV